MKKPISLPVIIGGIAVAVACVAFYFVKNVTAEPHTPRPDPAMFGYSNTGSAKPSTAKTP